VGTLKIVSVGLGAGDADHRSGGGARARALGLKLRGKFLTPSADYITIQKKNSTFKKKSKCECYAEACGLKWVWKEMTSLITGFCGSRAGDAKGKTRRGKKIKYEHRASESGRGKRWTIPLVAFHIAKSGDMQGRPESQKKALTGW